MVVGSNGNDRRNVHNPSLPLCSREGGTAVPDEIEVVACSVYCVCAVQKCCKQLLNAQH